MAVHLLASAILFALPVNAQDHGQSHNDTHSDHHNHSAVPEMDHSAHNRRRDSNNFEQQSIPEQTHTQHHPQDHNAHQHTGHSEHNMAQVGSIIGVAPESAVPERAFEGPIHAADMIWGAQNMRTARAKLANENGGLRTGSILVERLETQASLTQDENSFIWDAQGWYGGDTSRLVVKVEGESELSGSVDHAEIQTLYSHAVGPFFDLQTGVRVDLEPNNRTHFVIGLQGLAPYMFHVDGAFFLADSGDLTGKIKGEYDQKITQQLILQPRIELAFSAQDILERNIGVGITKIDAGARLRYEFVPEFAPYLGVEYGTKVGETADLHRTAGKKTGNLKFLFGIRTWF